MSLTGTRAALLPLALGPDIPSVWLLLAAAVTQLGDVWFLVLVTGIAYWRGTESLAPAPGRAGASLIAVGLTALALTVGLKSLFAVPRPPGAGTATPPAWLPSILSGLFVDAATADGFAFPSGHALGSTMVYFGAAALFRRLDSIRWWIAGGIVMLVSSSRVVLGVHSVGDVVAGVLVGAIALAGVVRILETGTRQTPSPARGFILASGLAGGAIVIAIAGGHDAEVVQATLSLGASAGGFIAWQRVPGHGPVRASHGILGATLVAVCFGVAVTTGTGSLPRGVRPIRPLVAGVAAMLAAGLLVAWPGLEDRDSA